MKRFTILGERCSGTHYLQYGMLFNFEIEYVRGEKHFYVNNSFNTFIEVLTYQDFKLERQTSWTNQFLPIFLVGLILFRFLLGSSHKKEQETKPVRSDGNYIVEQLSELGYFKYMNDSEKIDELKKQTVLLQEIKQILIYNDEDKVVQFNVIIPDSNPDLA
jgi:hypothetical protein